jgi:hypothetical protein
MLGLGVLLASFFLGIRSFLLFFLEEKSWTKSLFDVVLSLVYFAIFSFLLLGIDHQYNQPLSVKFLLLLGISILSGLSVLFRVRNKKKRSFFFNFCKTFGFTCYLFLSFCLFGFAAMRRFTEDRPIFKIVFTGERKAEFIEWKNPGDSLKKALLHSHKVILETMEGKPVASFFVIGEQVAIRAKVIRFQPIFLALGFQNLCTIDGIYNGYMTVEKANAQPLMGYPIPSKASPVYELLWNWWESLFFQDSRSSWIKSATLESCYFPLVDKEGNPFEGSYLLTITEGGLSSVPFNFNR